MHAKETALLSVYKYLSGQQLKRVGATEKICGVLGLCLGFFKPTYRESGKHMKKQFAYDIFTPKQNLPELKSLHSNYINQL